MIANLEGVQAFKNVQEWFKLEIDGPLAPDSVTTGYDGSVN